MRSLATAFELSLRGRLLLGSLRLSALMVFLLGGCSGYQIGTESLYSPGIRTVYVPMFRSSSFREGMAERLTEAVCKEIEQKTPFKVVGTPNADSVLTGVLVREEKKVEAINIYDDPRLESFSLEVQLEWKDQRGNVIRRMEPVLLQDSFAHLNSDANLVPEFGHSTATSSQQAVEEVAKQIVGMMEAPW